VRSGGYHPEDEQGSSCIYWDLIRRISSSQKQGRLSFGQALIRYVRSDTIERAVFRTPFFLSVYKISITVSNYFEKGN
jgi:hypothetical protein